jgi:hypothetical protein
MKELVVLCGPQGSAKTTYAKSSLASYTYISQDEQGKPGYINNLKAALERGDNVVIDRMNHLKEQRKGFITEAKALGYTTRIIVFHVPYAVCHKRCMERANHPNIPQGDNVIVSRALNTFFTKYERVEDGEADTIERKGWDGAKDPAIICDLDGTLCTIDHRLHFIKGEGKKNWAGFFGGIKDDKINTWCDEIIFSMKDFYSIVLCSGRPDDHRQATVDWLKENTVSHDNLFMRHRGDYRADDIVKEMLLDFEILTQYKPLFAIDDRQRVIKMWRKRGIVCLDCCGEEF